MGPASGSGVKGLRRRYPDDQLVVDPRAPARRQRPKKDDRSRCMGRSRGGLTTKIHALVDAEGLPIALKLTEGQAHDGRSAQDMLGDLAAGPNPARRSRLRQRRPAQSLAERGAWANIKPMTKPQGEAVLQRLPVSLPQPRRALLQQAQTLPSRRNPIRQAGRQFPR